MDLSLQEKLLLSKILELDCSYLENCTQEEFKTYLNLRGRLYE